MGRDWSGLPIDIAASIALKSETFEDFIRFSSVCRSWNRASSLIKRQWRPSSPVPWLLLSENTHDNPNFVRKLYNISSNKFYHLNLPETFGKRCWGSSYGWVAMLGRDLKVELFNPITKDKICFPSLEAIYKELTDGFGTGDDLLLDFIYHILKKLFVIKVSQGDLHEFVIVVIHDYHQAAAFAWPGDRTWTSITVKQKARMVSVLGKDDNMFALYSNGSIVYWKVKELCRREIVNPIDYCPPAMGEASEALEAMRLEKSIYLVESSGDFLMVLRYREDSYMREDFDASADITYETLGFGVFILDEKHKSWEEIKDLDSMALFVGDNYPLSVPLSLDKCLKHNSIYATDDFCDNWLISPKVVGLDMGIFDYKTDEKSPLYNGDDLRPSFPPPIWFVPQF